MGDDNNNDDDDDDDDNVVNDNNNSKNEEEEEDMDYNNDGMGSGGTIDIFDPVAVARASVELERLREQVSHMNELKVRGKKRIFVYFILFYSISFFLIFVGGYARIERCEERCGD